MPKFKEEGFIFVLLCFSIVLTFSLESIMIFFAASLSSLDTYEVITIDNFEKTHENITAMKEKKNSTATEVLPFTIRGLVG